MSGQWAAFRARAAHDPSLELAVRRRLQPRLVAEHVAFVALLVTGALLMQAHGWSITRARWLTFKLGLVVFLVVPFEAMHAFICHGWIATGLRRSQAPALARELERGIGVEEMLRTLAIPLLGVGVPLLVWLSVQRPF